jgi:hypothetical protein
MIESPWLFSWLIVIRDRSQVRRPRKLPAVPFHLQRGCNQSSVMAALAAAAQGRESGRAALTYKPSFMVNSWVDSLK